MLRNERIKNGIFITNASLIIGDFTFSSQGNKEFVVYPAGKKIFLFASFVIDKKIEKKLGFIYVTPDESSLVPIDYQHVTDVSQRSFFFELNDRDFNLLEKFKIAAFEIDKIKSTFRPVAKDFIYTSPLIINSMPAKQIELAKLISIKDENTITTILNKMSLFGSTNNTKEIPEKFFCLITQEVMKEPAICTLDGKTYEKSIITAWLNKHRSAPHNRALMDEDQTVDDVLISDNRLIKLIHTFRLQHPELFDESLQLSKNIQRSATELKYS